MFCTKCGNEVTNEKAKFCTKCGTPLPIAEEKNDEQKVEQKPDIIVHKKEDIIEIVDETKENDIKEEREEEIPEKSYSPLEQAINNMQNRQKKCPHCGMMVLNEARFCANCGKKI